MKITKKQLKQIIEEELEKTLNEISPKTVFHRGGLKGIEEMAQQAEWALDNLEQKFDKPPEEIYTIQKFLEAIKKISWWGSASGEATSAMHHVEPEEYKKQLRRVHTAAYKRDTE